jgi:hypothetical protein
MTAAININAQPTPTTPGQTYDRPPAGYVWLTDENGNWITDENNNRIAVPQ